MSILQQTDKRDLQSLKFENTGISEVELIESGLYNALSDSSGVIREMCMHILSAGGKRVRPLLVLYSGMIFSPLSDELINAGIAAELIHMASLVHDDIIDNSPKRRSKPSINKVWGNHFSVLCGDYLFAKAFGILSGNRLIKSMNTMVEAICNMCHGEILQASNAFNYEDNLEMYYDRIAKKTGIFLECCCKSGALIAGGNEIQVQIIGQYGLNLGYAFQIIDDILDFCGESNIMGKPKNEDLCQGNITLPIILLIGNEKYGSWIREIIKKREFTRQTIENIIGALEESGCIGKAYNIATSHIEKAKQCLDMLPLSKNVEFLRNMADILQTRVN